MLLTFRHENENLLPIFLSVFVLTVGDAVFSAWEVKMGWMTEGNILIRDAVMNYPVETSTIIALLVGIVLYGIWQVQHRIAWLRNAMISILVVKAGIIAYHLYGIILIASSYR
jgi:hypothetical protein